MHPHNEGSKDLIDEILQRRKNFKNWKRFLTKKTAIIVAFIVITPLAFSFFWGNSINTVELKANFLEVTKTDLKTVVSSSGKVVAEDGVAVSFSTIGEPITTVYVKEGDFVHVGDKLASIDATDLQLDLKSAQNSLNTAYANLQEKLDGATAIEIAIQQKSVDSTRANLEKTRENNNFSIQQAETKLANLQKDLDSILSGSAETDSTLEAIAQTYENALLKVDSILVDVKNTIDEGDNMLDDENSYYFQLGALDSAKLRGAENGFRTSRIDYNDLLKTFATISSASEKTEIVAKIDAATNLTNKLADVSSLLYDTFENTIASAIIPESEISSLQSSALSLQSEMSSDQQSLISAKQSINSQILSKSEKVDSLRDDIVDAETSLAETKATAARNEASAQNSLDVSELNFLKLKEPATKAELASLRAQVNSAQVNVAKIQRQIDKATLTAPIDGTIVELNGQVGDLIIKDQNETFATILNKDTFFIEVNIEEVEVNQIQKGQKVIVTFDAIEEVEVEGEVNFVSLMSVTSGGIVTYPVRITLKDWSAAPIREGMTTYTDFIIGEANDVLAVPVGAIVNRGGKSFVSLKDGSPREVETGFSDGSLVAIKSGLTEGEKIIENPSSNLENSNALRTGGSDSQIFTEEERAAIQSMTDEERKAFLESKGLGAGSGMNRPGGGMGGYHP